MKTKIDKSEIGEKLEDILSKIVSNPKFVPLATGLALSAVGIIMSLSSGDHSQWAFAAKHAGCHAKHVIGVCPTKAIFW
jgi:hypothetical protein